VSVLEVATRFAPKFLSSHILPVLGKRTVLYLNPLKFIVPLVSTGPAVFLWTRDPFVDKGVQQAKYLSIDSSGVGFNNLDRAYSFSIRCIKTKFSVSTANDPPEPSKPTGHLAAPNW
jgi:hypothetical protein